MALSPSVPKEPIEEVRESISPALVTEEMEAFAVVPIPSKAMEPLFLIGISGFLGISVVLRLFLAQTRHFPVLFLGLYRFFMEHEPDFSSRAGMTICSRASE